MNRGPRKQTLFFDEEDYAFFLETLGQLPDRFGVLPEAYALMRNHYHTQLLSLSGRLSEAMQFLGGTYSSWLNRKHAWDGSAFKGRFRNRLVVREAHLLYLPVYIHLNPDPARPGLVDRFTWTSHRAWVGLEPRPRWLHPEKMLELYGGVRGYRRHLAARMDPPEGFGDVWRSPDTQVVGHASAEPEALLALIATLHGRSVDSLRAARPGCTGDPAAAMAAWCLCALGGLSQVAAATLLGITPSAVSRRLAAWRTRWAEDPEVGCRMDVLLEMLRTRAA